MKKCKLSDIAIIVAGQSPKSEYYTLDHLDTPFLQGNRTFGDKYPYIDTYTKKVTKLAPKNSVLMSVRAPVGDLNIATDNCCIGRGLCSINATNGDNEFLYYLLKHNIKSIVNQGNGTTYDSINKEQLENLEIQLPSENKDDLKKISNLLSALDDKIQNNNKINSELESMAKTIYDYYFLQFEFPNEDGKPYKSSGGKMVWNEELQQYIPEKWDSATLEDCVEEICTGGDAIQKCSITNEDTGIRCLRVGDITNNREFQEWGFSSVNKENYNKYKLKKDDIIITRTACNGLSKFIYKDLESVFNNGLIRLKVNSKYRPLYIFNTIHREEFINKCKIVSGDGSTRPNMKIQQLLDNYIIKPPIEMQKRFENIVLPLEKIKNNINEENRELINLMNFLLPILMNGQVGFKENINVKEIEVGKEEVLT